MGVVLSLVIAVAMVGILSVHLIAEPSALELRMPAILTGADNGRAIELRVGDDVVLRLPENATTGYRWGIDAADESLVEIKEGEYSPASNAIGVGGEVQWIVHAKAPGVTQVKLKRWRRWEGERSVVERYEITLRIVA
jgi:inhibitor of cysteine peptidase